MPPVTEVMTYSHTDFVQNGCTLNGNVNTRKRDTETERKRQCAPTATYVC
jgi:hypothetical protein